jgi:hypothetical protein
VRDPVGVTESNRGIYDPLGNYIPFQQPADPRPAPGSFSSASMSGLSGGLSNPHSYGNACYFDGVPMNCTRAAMLVNHGAARIDTINGISLSSQGGASPGAQQTATNPQVPKLKNATRQQSTGQTIEFMLSARRDVSAAKRFFKKMLSADHRRLPFTIGTDKHASYPEAFATSLAEKILPRDCKLRRVKYLNNIIEQDHRAIRRRWRAMQCFRSFHTAERTIEGIEAMHTMRKGQVKRLDGRDTTGQAKFVESLFRFAA